MYINDAALLLFSGGQDSTTSLFWALKRFASVHALCFVYGQRHANEVEVAKQIAAKSGVSFQVIDASFIGQLASNSLTDFTLVMDKEGSKDALPNTFVPGRNLFFLTMAAALAYDLQIKHLITGVSEADYSGYPDCRAPFIKSANQTINLAMDHEFIIHTPLMHATKADVWAMSAELGVFELIKNETLTCYKGIIASGCGECPACKLRQRGLELYLNSQK